MQSLRNKLLEELVLPESLDEFKPWNTLDLMRKIHMAIDGGGAFYLYVRRDGTWQINPLLDKVLGAELFYHSTGFAGPADTQLGLTLQNPRGMKTQLDLVLGTKLAIIRLPNQQYTAIYLRQPDGTETLCLRQSPSRVSPRS